jgi:hypothetical protein
MSMLNTSQHRPSEFGKTLRAIAAAMAEEGQVTVEAAQQAFKMRFRFHLQSKGGQLAADKFARDERRRYEDSLRSDNDYL